MITYRNDFGMWWPDYDAAPARTLAYVRKHIDDVNETIRVATRKRVCVQAGGHVGIWPLRLARHFDAVLTFEPDPALFECLKRNTQKSVNIQCFPVALGASPGEASMRVDAKAGSWSIDPGGSVPVRMTTIDLALRTTGIYSCDAIVLDVEGYEVDALLGASETIRRDRPVIHVEELKRHRLRTSEYVRSLGYVEHARFGHDAVYINIGER